MVRNLVSAPWQALHPLVCIRVYHISQQIWFEKSKTFVCGFKDKLRTMKAWSKYSEVLNDPVRNLNMRLRFQNGEISMQPHYLLNVRILLDFCSSIHLIDYGHFYLIQESILSNASLPATLDYDEEIVMAVPNDNETRFESQEEQQNLRMHTPALTYEIPSLPQSVEVTLSGTGCAILQVQLILLTGRLVILTVFF